MQKEDRLPSELRHDRVGCIFGRSGVRAVVGIRERHSEQYLECRLQKRLRHGGLYLLKRGHVALQILQVEDEPMVLHLDARSTNSENHTSTVPGGITANHQTRSNADIKGAHTL